MFSIVGSGRLAAFRKVIDEFLDNYFESKFLYKFFLQSMTELFEDGEKDDGNALKSALKVVEYHWKIIDKSRQFFLKENSGEDDFKQNILKYFDSVNKTMKNVNKFYLTIQMLIMKNVYSTFRFVKKYMSTQEFSNVLVGLLDSTEYLADRTKINEEKLDFIFNFLNTLNQENEEDQSIIISLTSFLLKDLNKFYSFSFQSNTTINRDKAAKILSYILSFYLFLKQVKGKNEIERFTNQLSSVFPFLVSSLHSSSNKEYPSVISYLLSFHLFSQNNHIFLNFINSSPGKENISKSIQIFRDILTGERKWPQNLFSLNTFNLTAYVSVLRAFSIVLLERKNNFKDGILFLFFIFF